MFHEVEIEKEDGDCYNKGKERSKLMRKGKMLFTLIGLLGIFLFISFLYRLNVIPHTQYSNEDFGINSYISLNDQDQDGIDDQTDILYSARAYLKTKPKYKSKYYGTGYPDDGYGVCTDVVAFALLNSGYDLMELVNEDVLNHRELYDIEFPDKNIDFRRVRNLKIYFQNNAVSLTTDLSLIEEWQGGDLVLFKNHIAVISDKRNRNGIPFIIHLANPYQLHYEEDLLEYYRQDITGHFRIKE